MKTTRPSATVTVGTWLARSTGILCLAALAELPATVPGVAAPVLLSCTPPVESAVPPARFETMMRGFNLTAWLDGASTRRPDFSVLASLRRRGFTHIRLPIRAERFMSKYADQADLARDFAELDFALGRLIGLGFAVSLDLHPGSRLGRLQVEQPEAAFELIGASWRELARRYADRPPSRLFFEVLNEPGFAPQIWNQQGWRLVDIIRGEAPDHTIIYGPSNFQRIDALLELTPLAHTNVVYAVHFYDPMAFTHQGLDWAEDPTRYLAGVPFPAKLSDPTVQKLLVSLADQGRPEVVEFLRRQLAQPWTTERVRTEFLRVAQWTKKHRRPVIVNEFGVLAWKAPRTDRALWIGTVRDAAERNCIGWAHWDYAEGFGLVQRRDGKEIPDDTIVRALVGE